ncbi:unnamed protein product [Tilletia controversa]|nr:unnamed protein product [Tilletia controversa]
MHERMLQQQWANHRSSTPQLYQQYSQPQRDVSNSNHHHQQARHAQPLRQAFGAPTMLPAAALPGGSVSRQGSSYSHSTTSSVSVASILSGPLKLKPGQLVPKFLSSATGSCSSSDVSGSPPGSRMMSFNDQRWQPNPRPGKVHSPPRAVLADPPNAVPRIRLRVANPSSTTSSRQRPRMPPKQLSTSSEDTLQGPDDQIAELISLYRNRSVRQSTKSRPSRASTPNSASRSLSKHSLRSVEITSDGESMSKTQRHLGLGIAFVQGYTGRRNASACVTAAAAAARARVQARRTGKALDSSLADLLAPEDFVPPERRSSLVRTHDPPVGPISPSPSSPPGRRSNAASKEAAPNALSAAKDPSRQPKSERKQQAKPKSSKGKLLKDLSTEQRLSPQIGSELEAVLRMMRTPSVRKAGQEIDFTDERVFSEPGTSGLLAEARAERTIIARQPISSASSAKKQKGETKRSAPLRKPISTPTLPLVGITSSGAVGRQTFAKAGSGLASNRFGLGSESAGTVAPLRIRPKLAAGSPMLRISSKSVSKNTITPQASLANSRSSTPSRPRGKLPTSASTTGKKLKSGPPSLSTRSSNISMATTARKAGRMPTSQSMKTTASKASVSVYSQQSASRSPSVLSDAEGFDDSASAMRVVEHALAKALRGGVSSDSLGESTSVEFNSEDMVGMDSLSSSTSSATLMRMSSSSSSSAASDDTVAEGPQMKGLIAKLDKAASRSMQLSASTLSNNSCLTTTTTRSRLRPPQARMIDLPDLSYLSAMSKSSSRTSNATNRAEATRTTATTRAAKAVHSRLAALSMEPSTSTSSMRTTTSTTSSSLGSIPRSSAPKTRGLPTSNLGPSRHLPKGSIPCSRDASSTTKASTSEVPYSRPRPRADMNPLVNVAGRRFMRGEDNVDDDEEMELRGGSRVADPSRPGSAWTMRSTMNSYSSAGVSVAGSSGTGTGASRLPVPVRKRGMLPPSKLVHQMRLATAVAAAAS